MKKNVLILGASGMLGSMILDVFSKDKDLKLTATFRDGRIGKILKTKYENVKFKKFDAEKTNKNTLRNLTKNNYYIINAIGVIKPYIKDDDIRSTQRAILVNSLFPHLLAKATYGTNAKVIQIATDCVYSGSKGSYTEQDPHDSLDVYGKTKSLGEVYYGNFLNIRCSIVGPEKNRATSLMKWFLSQPDNATINGYAHHKWNGATTLQFARLCLEIIKKKKFDKLLQTSRIHHFTPNNSINKFEMLKLFSDVFGKKVKIKKTNKPQPSIDRTLKSKYKLLSELLPHTTFRKALVELRDYSLK